VACTPPGRANGSADRPSQPAALYRAGVGVSRTRRAPESWALIVQDISREGGAEGENKRGTLYHKTSQGRSQCEWCVYAQPKRPLNKAMFSRAAPIHVGPSPKSQ